MNSRFLVKNRRIPMTIGRWLAAILVLALLPCVGIAGASKTLDEQLIESAKKGDLAVVESLLDRGANIDVGDSIGRTPLMYAALESHVEVVRLLLGKGADVNAKDKFSCTPLLLARDPEAVRLLLDRGADINARASDGATVLMMPVAMGDTDVMRALLAKGADVNEAAENGYTALMYAAGGGCLETLKLLLDKGANINAKANDGYTALMYAATCGELEVLKLLVENGANVNAKSRDGSTALMAACGKYYGWEEEAHSLMAKIIDILRGRWSKFGPSYPKIGKKDPEVVKFLLENGAEVHARSPYGWTALKWAKEAGTPEMVAILKAYGAKN